MFTFVRVFVLAVTCALVATLVSTVANGTATAVDPDPMECHHAGRVAVAGWPATYLVDYPRIAPVVAVSPSDVTRPVDEFRPAAFAVSLGFWLVVFAALVAPSSGTTGRS